MLNFGYVRVASPQEAVSALGEAETDGARILAGGTDLVPLVKDEIVTPRVIVDISGWAEGAEIRQEGDRLMIGALTPLSAIADHAVVQGRFTALADACRMAATPQLRNMGTIGGNLLQQTRCWYYRGPFDCWLKGGEKCYARDGENENHSVFATDTSPCVSAHPSDPAAALLAFDARVRFTAPDGDGEMALEKLYALPDDSRREFARLPEGAVITAVVLPMPAEGARSVYLKAMPRASWSFALAGVVVVVEGGSAVSRARIVLSGVAPIPMRVPDVEDALIGQSCGSLDHGALAALLVAGAKPLSHNGYKVKLLQGVFKEALEAVCRAS